MGVKNSWDVPNDANAPACEGAERSSAGCGTAIFVAGGQNAACRTVTREPS